MSHMTKLDKANIVNADAFIAAANELGLKTEKNAEIKDWARKSVKVHVAVRTEARYDIGLQKNGSKFDMIGDFSMMQISPELSKKVVPEGKSYASGYDVANRLLALTTKHTLIAQYRRQGFAARIQEDAQRNIVVTLTR